MPATRDIEEEIDNEEETSLLTSDEKHKKTRDIPLCGYLTIEYYQSLFDVDTTEVYSRIWHSIFFCGRGQNFMTMIGDKPDAYGPFWVRLFDEPFCDLR